MATSSSEPARGGSYADVILPLAIDSLTYAVPPTMTVRPGQMVSVPIGERKTYSGVVLRVHDDKPPFDCRPLDSVLTEQPVATDEQLWLWQWIADYYMASPGDVLTTAMPATVRRQMAAQRVTGHLLPEPQNDTVARTHPLTPAQTKAYDEIVASFRTKDITLLHGVTSSGKTEIYIRLISEVIARGRQVLYLLPEIALTVQIRERLRRVFGERLCVYHSKNTDSRRAQIWQRQLSDNAYDVVLGARSAVFLPMRRLGLVIIDEEHDGSFKQQDHKPRYHARSVAAVMARRQGAKMLLGTATPSAESYHNAMTGKYGLVTLTQRYDDMQLPEIKVVDVRDMRRRKMMEGPFSPQLLDATRRALDDGRQVILFQNRRGFAPMIECKTCGWVPRCEHCDVSLTYHKASQQLTCHYCGHTYSVPDACPCCGDTKLTSRGLGTEKIEESIAAIFPEARIVRMDLDTTRQKTSHENIINDFAAGRTDILIGTQMITKGLDFDGVSVVGILNADTLLNMPDFRAHEQAFTMMAQVAGRAGRKGQRGLVILQTNTPEAAVINHVVNNNTTLFFDELFLERQVFHYPPFYRLIDIYLRHRQNAVVDNAAADLGNRLRQWFGERVLGPERPAVARVKGLSLRKIMLKIEPGLDGARVRHFLRAAEQQTTKIYTTVQVLFDVDP